ncbi:MAG: hypothetical protein ACKOI0_00600 [Actinomycetota bacterium]
MKKLIAIALGVTLLVGGSIAFAGGYVHTSSDDDADETEQSQEIEAQDVEDASDADAPGQQVATGADYLGSGPRGLEVAQIAIADHKGDLPQGLAKAISNATLDHSSGQAKGSSADEQGDTAN